jgi:four helix bundle protein
MAEGASIGFLAVYRLTENFPKSELFGLTSQMRRAAISIPANIAEGYKKRGKPDKLRLVNVAQGSLEELRYYFILSKDLGYGDTSAHVAAPEVVSKLFGATWLESSGIGDRFLHRPQRVPSWLYGWSALSISRATKHSILA